jgi:replicative superfamily II helicase
MVHLQVLSKVVDENLQHSLQFGIGLHHAALGDSDRRLTEELFCAQKIQILVATSTLAWGVNTPAHLVIVKGTEFFDGKTKRWALQELCRVAACGCSSA